LNSYQNYRAALDSESEKKVVETLGMAMTKEKTKCMLMVTHRLGVIRSLSVNKVVVLDRGRIAEVGDPETLLKQNGIYSQLAREQGILPLTA
jgi:ABC-type multidrug transport system fused ATPase/permease subunit